MWDREDEAREQKLRQRPVSALVKAVVTAPPYGQRKGFVPRNPEVSDFITKYNPLFIYNKYSVFVYNNMICNNIQC